MGHSLEEGEEEVDQLQVGQEGEAEVVGVVDHHQGEEVAVGVVAVLPCCPAKGEEAEGVAVEVLRGLVGEEEVEGVVVQKALELSQPLDLVQ